LFDITKVFRDQKVYIQTALISTEVDQVADVFYVKDQMGNKIGSQESLENLESALYKVLGSDPMGETI
jgi:[protein-PII] uridylyltransferase